MGLIVFLAIAIVLLVVVGWIAFDESLVRIEPGQLGLVLVHGRPTDKALDPGPHWVPAFRRRMVQTYPSLELSFRAGEAVGTSASELERAGPPLRVTLGDRVTVLFSYTVRFRLDRATLRQVHERFGPAGFWIAVRDASARRIRASLADAGVGVDDLFEASRAGLEQRVGDDVSAALTDLGLVMTMFSFGDLDLGRTGDVIQATARARHEVDREEAEAPMRMARARIDADLAPYLTTSATDAAIRYRAVDAWQQFAGATAFVQQDVGRTGAVDAPASAALGPPEVPLEEQQ